MKFQNTEVMNFEGAFRGLRNPLESWDKSDSYFGLINIEYDDYHIDEVITSWVENQNKIRVKENKQPIEEGSKEYFDLWDKYWDWWYSQCLGILQRDGDALNVACIGPKDLDLAQRMIRAGSSDRKFMRQIMVSVDITAPLYWWKEFDTYKVGTVANSTSTMHKLSSTSITIDCFETDDMTDVIIENNNDPTFVVSSGYAFNTYINWLEELRQRYNETKDQSFWKELIRLLPESWLQTRTVTMNYEILKNIYSQRKHHRLTEWHQFCNWIKTLPYGQELITLGLDK